MKKRALRKDFYMEIRRSLGRFLSIFFIVAIGCAFFSGIRASEPDMRYSGDAYFDNKNMMDLRIISTMGRKGGFKSRRDRACGRPVFCGRSFGRR